MAPLERPWSLAASDVCDAVGVEPGSGVASEEEVERRRRTYGQNLLEHAAPRSVLDILVAQLRSFIVGLLVVAAVLSMLLGEHAEAVAILVVIVINTVIGFATEYRAVRSMEALRALSDVLTTVRRGGSKLRVPAEDLVVGDVVVLDAGDVVTADLRLLEASGLQADESPLTGESVPVLKQSVAVPVDAPLSERASMLFKGTRVTRGSAEAVVVAVGMATELGRITALVDAAADEDTPLERRLEALGRTLAWASLAFVALVAAVGLAFGRPLFGVLQTAIALAVATVPEGLPVVATVALARGMWRMARRNALIEHLPAVETLGSTSVVLTDKTGTLTENQMTLARVELPRRALGVSGTGLEREGRFVDLAASEEVEPGAEPALGRLLRAGALCTDAELGREDDAAVGDPMEIALLVAASKAGLDPTRLRAEAPELREEAFDPGTRMMATYHQTPAGVEVAVKGAPEAVLAACSRVARGASEEALDAGARARWLERADALGEEGLRVLAVADKRVADVEEAPYAGLVLLGLVGLVDPPRGDVRAAIEVCARAGIRVIMVTGDQPRTAAFVARAVGLPAGDDAPLLGSDVERVVREGGSQAGPLLEASVIARSSPEQKLRLLELHQGAGAVVAMVGDGVNDAPALRQADIGVAMGLRGTQVAREAADMVLRDDRLGTITVAVEQGRVIFENIRAFVLYLVSCNLSEILVVGLASLTSAPLPIQPLQILFLNLVTDVFPALALGVSEGHGGIMERPPRAANEPMLTRAHWRRIVGFSGLMAAPVLLGFALARSWLAMDDPAAVTVAFLILAWGQLAHVLNMADRDAPALRNHVTRNPWVWAALLLCVVLLLMAVYTPWLAAVLRTRDPGAEGWLLVAVLGASPALVGLTFRALSQRMRA